MSTIRPTAVKLEQFMKDYVNFQMPDDNVQGAFSSFKKRWESITCEIRIYTNTQWKIEHIDLVNDASNLAKQITWVFRKKITRMEKKILQQSTLSPDAPEFVPQYRLLQQ